MPYAVSAHSQFYQSLASAGIVGVAGLAIYAMTLFRFALKTAKSSKGLSMALFIMLFLESISETPLSIYNLGPELMLHLFLLMIIAAHLAPRNVENLDSKTPIYKFVSPGGVA
jgi:O-antigen ligase